jgi:hypothetical protein
VQSKTADIGHPGGNRAFGRLSLNRYRQQNRKEQAGHDITPQQLSRALHNEFLSETRMRHVEEINHRQIG